MEILIYLIYITYTAEIILMGISIIGFISYNKDCKNIFQNITTTKTIILFIISMIISLLVFYVLIYTVLRVYFTIASISFSIFIIKHIFIIFALLLAIFRSPLAFASLFIAFLLSISGQIELLLIPTILRSDSSGKLYKITSNKK